MGVAATAGLDATSTNVPSNINPLTSGIPEFTVNGGTFAFDSGGMTINNGASANKLAASGHRGVDLSWRWVGSAAIPDTAAQFDIVATSADASSQAGNQPNCLRVMIYQTGLYIYSSDTSGAFSEIRNDPNAFPTGATIDVRSVVTESGLWTLTVRNVNSGAVVILLDSYDVTATAFWTTNSGRARSWIRLRCQSSGTLLKTSRWRESSHPSGETVRALRNSLIQLSDGTSAWVQATQSATDSQISVWRDAKGTQPPALLAQFSSGTRLLTAPLLCRDASDNLYVGWTRTNNAYGLRGLTRSGGASPTWTLSSATLLGPGSNPYHLHSMAWANTGQLVIEMYLPLNATYYVLTCASANVLAGSGPSSSSTPVQAAVTPTVVIRRALVSMDTASAASGVIVQPLDASTVRVYRVVTTSSGATLGGSVDLALPQASQSTMTLVRVGTAQWVLTSVNAAQKLIAWTITASGSAAPSASGPNAATASVLGEPFLGFGDAYWDGARLSQVQPSDAGASLTTTDYIRTRYDPASGTWSAPAAFSPVAAQAKEIATVVATSALTLAPEVTRGDGSTDWLVTSLGAPSGGGSSVTYTVHATDVTKVFVNGQVRNGDGSVYTGGALVAIMRADGSVAATTTSAASDGSYTLPVPSAGTYEIVAFSADAAMTAAVGLKAT